MYVGCDYINSTTPLRSRGDPWPSPLLTRRGDGVHREAEVAAVTTEETARLQLRHARADADLAAVLRPAGRESRRCSRRYLLSTAVHAGRAHTAQVDETAHQAAGKNHEIALEVSDGECRGENVGAVGENVGAVGHPARRYRSQREDVRSHDHVRHGHESGHIIIIERIVIISSMHKRIGVRVVVDHVVVARRHDRDRRGNHRVDDGVVGRVARRMSASTGIVEATWLWPRISRAFIAHGRCYVWGLDYFFFSFLFCIAFIFFNLEHARVCRGALIHVYLNKKLL